MPFAAVRDLRVYHETLGLGPRLLYLGGTGGDLRRTPSVFDSPLPGRFAVLAFDQRGQGRTAGPDLPCTVAEYADDAAGLLEFLGWEACPVLGFSFGGMVAQELALRHPARVTRLVLASTSAGGPGGSSYPLHQLFALPPEEAARRLVALRDSRRGTAWQAGHPREFRALLAEARHAVERARAPAARRQLEARRGHDTWDRLPALRLPVLVCGGRHDRISPPANLRSLRARIPGATLELFAGGHHFFGDDPTAWSRVAAFLCGDPAGSPLP